MNEIFLVRHTTPAVGKGVCYGQTDLDVTETFADEAAAIRSYLPLQVRSVHSSPLQRCTLLAGHLFPAHTPVLHKELMEIYCGQWEMKLWDELPKDEIDPWMNDFVRIRIPGGESYLDLHDRVTRCFERIRNGAAAAGSGAGGGNVSANGDKATSGRANIHGNAGPIGDESSIKDAGVHGAAIIVAHGGVIRSILSHITGTPLQDSFKAFSLYYGCVVRLFEQEGVWRYETLFNQAPGTKEQHKPSSYYK